MSGFREGRSRPTALYRCHSHFLSLQDGRRFPSQHVAAWRSIRVLLSSLWSLEANFEPLFGRNLEMYSTSINLPRYDRISGSDGRRARPRDLG